MKFFKNTTAATTTTSGYGMFPEAIVDRRFGFQLALSPDNGASGANGLGGDALPPEPPAPSSAPDSKPSSPPEQPTGEDLTGLKKALESERNRAKDLERQFKQFQESIKGIDPEKYKQLEILQKQAEEWNRKEIEIRNNYERDFTERFKVEQDKTAAWEAKFNELLVRTEAERAYQLAEGRSGAGDDGTTFFEAFFTNIRGRLQLNEQGKLEVVDPNGTRLYSKKNASQLMSPAEYFSDLVTHPVFGTFFERRSTAKGGGMNPNQVPNGVVVGGEDLNALSASERLTILRARRDASTRR